MLKALLQGGGRASLKNVAAAFLALDEAQLEYYEEITKRMPGPVLTRHGLVERDGNSYRLKAPLNELTEAERAELVTICDAKVAEYLQRRGVKAYDHRRTALGDLSGNVRYEVFKRAGFRCELCGSPAQEKALEVDHILPRKHGGKDALENLQALCWQCNANKGDRDATAFRAIREGLEAKHEGCIFCELPADRTVASNTLAVAFRDGFPVAPLHTLVVPRRHAATWFDLSDPERRALSILMDEARTSIMATDKTVQGFNVGMNCGEVAGQTVGHAHVHLIPRRKGDVEDLSGGVRGVIPGKQKY
jgi:diadenosine tetraphosphate (Ap4A) HIT family hydrolase